MLPRIIKAASLREVLTPEGCFIYENCGISTGDSTVSIARARIEPGVTTKAHHLDGIQEIYLIVKGKGRVDIEGLKSAEVVQGDIVVIPFGKSQQITNVGKMDLIFYCVCTPSFTQNRYFEEKTEKP
jgi:mannose-6-phosphate isomerase-like protein (cupin superfamily)